jgi:hypothetical protein
MIRDYKLTPLHTIKHGINIRVSQCQELALGSPPRLLSGCALVQVGKLLGSIFSAMSSDQDTCSCRITFPISRLRCVLARVLGLHHSGACQPHFQLPTPKGFLCLPVPALCTGREGRKGWGNTVFSSRFPTSE